MIQPFLAKQGCQLARLQARVRLCQDLYLKSTLHFRRINRFNSTSPLIHAIVPARLGFVPEWLLLMAETAKTLFATARPSWPPASRGKSMNLRRSGLPLALAASLAAPTVQADVIQAESAAERSRIAANHCGRTVASTFRGNAQHTGVYNTRDLRRTPELFWQFQTGGKVVSSPAVHQGVAYFGSYDGYLYAIDTRDGELKWKFKTSDHVKSTPTVWNNTVYFASKDGVFYALHACTGELLWQFKTADDVTHYYEQGIPWFPNGIKDEYYGLTNETRFARINDPWDCFYSSPTIAHGTVYFGAYDGNVYALNARQGCLKWQFQTDAPVRSAPAVYRNAVYVGSMDGKLFAIHAASGKEKWRRAHIGGEDSCPHIQSSPAVVDGVVYYGSRDSHVHAADAETGATLWTAFQGGAWVIGSPAVHESTVFVGTSDNPVMLAFDAKTGVEKWRFKTIGNLFSSPAVCGKTLYFADYNAIKFLDDGNIYALDLETGAEKWRLPTKGSVSSPVIEDGVLYIGTEDGYLKAFK